uniref:Uncharacterized protein n=1 Tax=Arundo donax TaxID=35708 RepID=A0A0A9FBP6_ARUDO
MSFLHLKNSLLQMLISCSLC